MRTVEAFSGTFTRIITRARELGSQVLPGPTPVFPESTPALEEIHRIRQLAAGIITPQDADNYRNKLRNQAANLANISTPPETGAALVNRRLEKIYAMTPEMMNQSIMRSAQAKLGALRERGIIS